MVWKYTCLLLLFAITACSSGEARVQSVGFEEPTREELKHAMRYHGVVFAEQGNDGEWYFYRDGQRCRLFAHVKHAE